MGLFLPSYKNKYMQHQLFFKMSMWELSIRLHVFWSCALFAAYSHFPLTFQGDELLMQPKRLPTNEQGGWEFSLSILSVSITLASLVGSPSCSTCSVPWALRRLDGQSMGRACVLPHNGLSVSMFFLFSLSSFWFYHFLSLLRSFLSSSVSDSFSHGRRRRDLLKRVDRQRKKEEE